MLQRIETDLAYVTGVVTSLCESLAPGHTVILPQHDAAARRPICRAMIRNPHEAQGWQGRDAGLLPRANRRGQSPRRAAQAPADHWHRGHGQGAGKSAELLFRRLGTEPLHCNWSTAELVKLFCNVSRYAYFGIVNALAMIALDMGVEPHGVMELANHDYPRKLVGKPGFTAGTCLRKDFGMLAESYWTGNFLTEMWRVNECLPNTWSKPFASGAAACKASGWPYWATRSSAIPCMPSDWLAP